MTSRSKSGMDTVLKIIDPSQGMKMETGPSGTSKKGEEIRTSTGVRITTVKRKKGQNGGPSRALRCEDHRLEAERSLDRHDIYE